MAPHTDPIVPTQKLFYTYTGIKFFILLVGMILVLRTCRVWYQVYGKLSNVVRAYILVFVADIVTILVYIPNAIIELVTGQLYTGSGEYPSCTQG